MFADLLDGPVRIDTHGVYPIEAFWIVTVNSSAVLDIGAIVPAVEVEVDLAALRQLIPDAPWWHSLGSCRSADKQWIRRGIDPAFFGVDDEGCPALPPSMTTRARSYCATCPVVVQCLTHALVEDERFGIWGGTTGRQRTAWRPLLRSGELSIEGLIELWLPELARLNPRRRLQLGLRAPLASLQAALARRRIR